MIAVNEGLCSGHLVSKQCGRFDNRVVPDKLVKSLACRGERVFQKAAIPNAVPFGMVVPLKDDLIRLDDVVEGRMPAAQARRCIVLGITSHRQ